MKQLKFAEDLVPLVLSGEKDSTWRLFDDKGLSPRDRLSLLNARTGQEFAKAMIISVKETYFDDLTEKDMRGHERFKSREEMFETYSRYYKTKVSGGTVLKIIKFRLV